ncbi:FimV/HubP family polar landmark protein [Luteimonas sp. e5]
MRKFLQTIVIATLLALVSAPAWALGLGQIVLKSRPGEPLLAEIPVIAEPAELANLQARLASPETFLRIGLPLPDSLVSDLQFVLAEDAAGQPVIRVTSHSAVNLPMLTFLVEVDWGEGRLVREYSLLMDAPEVVEATETPQIEVPEAAPEASIVREAEPATPVATPESAATPTSATPTPTASAPAPGNDAMTVRRGQTLSGIAAQLRAPGQSSAAVMAALMRANPEAFIRGNPHLLREGARLQLPGAEDITRAANDGAARELRSQLAAWGRARAARSGASAATEIAAAAPAASASGAAPATPARSDARLEIIPAAGSTATGTGGSGQGDAQMTQQLQEAHETIASRDAEVAELKSRVQELETLQQQQARLIEMKDSQLAVAEQQLKQRSADPAAGSVLPWLGLGALVLLLALLAWWLRGRRKPPVAPSDEPPSFTRERPQPVSSAALFAQEEENDEADAEPLGTPSWTGVPPQGELAQPAVDDLVMPVARTDWSGSLYREPDDAVPTPAGEQETAHTDQAAAAHADEWEPMPQQLPPGQGVFDAPIDGIDAEVAAETDAGSMPERSDEDAALDAQWDVAYPSADAGGDGDAAADDGFELPPMSDPRHAEAAERVALARTYLELEDATTARMLLEQAIELGGPHAQEARELLARLAG